MPVRSGNKPVKRESTKRKSKELNFEKQCVELTGKTPGVLLQERRFGVAVTPGSSVVMKLQLCLQALDSKLTGSGALSERMAKLPEEELLTFRRFRQELTSYIFGTQEPELKLRMLSANVVTAATGTLTSTVNISWYSIEDYTLWAACFDEVKMIRGSCAYWPKAVSPTNSDAQSIIAVACIDYTSSVAAMTKEIINEYDTAKWYYAFNSFDGAESSTQAPVWHWHSQGYPALQWHDMIVNYNVCQWLSVGFGDTGLGSAAVVGRLERDVIVRFRQVS